MNKLIVISGANITSGGPLTIFNDALETLSAIKGCRIIAIVSDKSQFYHEKNITFIELPKYKAFIFLKFYYEYVYYHKLSKQLMPDVWLSLNDFTPTVVTTNLFTYFHNAGMFFNIKPSDLIFSARVIFQKLYYNLFVGINMKRNKKVIVQQGWIGNGLARKFAVKKANLLIFRPDSFVTGTVVSTAGSISTDKLTVFYPTRANGYKDVEVICEAISILYFQLKMTEVEVSITLDGNENIYSKYLKYKYQNLPVRWLGNLSKAEVERHYSSASVLIFPSRLESWGLPLTEFARYNKPIFAIDLPYVHETLRGYKYLALFKMRDTEGLAKLLLKLVNKEEILYSNTHIEQESLTNITGWADLLTI
jgi:glycosyltransferase involved in cell wall biosynthesis